MLARCQIVTRFEIHDLADEPDEFFKLGEIARDGIAAAHERILVRRFGRPLDRANPDVAKGCAGHPGR